MLGAAISKGGDERFGNRQSGGGRIRTIAKITTGANARRCLGTNDREQAERARLGEEREKVDEKGAIRW